MNKQGQSIVEYSLIAILVILGVVFMGGYVLRSVDAHFKLWDEGTQDSFEENLTQANLNVIPFMNLDCSCTQTTGSCGGPGLLCPANEHEIAWFCNPQGCNGAAGNSTCSAPDQSCCGCPAYSNCGSQNTSTEASISPPSPMPCPTTTTSGQQCTNSSNIQGGSSCFCPVGSTFDSTTGNCSTPSAAFTLTSPCYYGYAIYTYPCGSTASPVCVPSPYNPASNTGCALPQCTGSISFPGSTIYCAGSAANASASLNINTSNTYVCGPCSSNSDCPQGQTPASTCDNSSGKCTNCANCSDSDASCTVYCVSPYTPNASPISSATQCVLNFVVAANLCTASTNFSQTYTKDTDAPACTSPSSSSSDTISCCNDDRGQNNCHGYDPTHPDNNETRHNNCIRVINDQSFTACSSGLPIASVTTSASFPVAVTTPKLGPPGLTNGNVCGSPEGMPGDGCSVDVIWGNNN